MHLMHPNIVISYIHIHVTTTMYVHVSCPYLVMLFVVAWNVLELISYMRIDHHFNSIIIHTPTRATCRQWSSYEHVPYECSPCWFVGFEKTLDEVMVGGISIPRLSPLPHHGQPNGRQCGTHTHEINGALHKHEPTTVVPQCQKILLQYSK